MRISDYVTIYPGANISGYVQLLDKCEIGSNACLLPSCTIGDSAVVGAGALVRKHVTAKSKVVGVPAHKIKSSEVISD